MIHAYNELYLSDAKQNLAEFFDYAINTCGFSIELFSRIFIQSGYAEKFERGNPAVIVGMSGIELAQRVIVYAYPDWDFPARIFSEERSSVYWAGWALAEYQWATCKRFKDIFSRIPFSDIVSMYRVYHEMDITKFSDRLDEIFKEKYPFTRLRYKRDNINMSQKRLAEYSGVALRQIQLFEQRQRSINKASAVTLLKLSRALSCSMEELIEYQDID